MRFIFTILTLINFSLFGQDGQIKDIDKKVLELDRYKKYEIVKYDSTELRGIDENLIETNQYSFRNKAIGKVEIKEKADYGFCLRTYYFDKGEIIHIEEKKYNQEVAISSLKYYFSKNTFIQAFDDTGVDKTYQVNRSELKDLITHIFGIVTK